MAFAMNSSWPFPRGTPALGSGQGEGALRHDTPLFRDRKRRCARLYAPPPDLASEHRSKPDSTSTAPSERDSGRRRSVKNRRDHRHHAVDAFVIGCTDRGLLQKISRAGQAEELHLDRLFPPGAFPEPFDGYRSAREVQDRARWHSAIQVRAASAIEI